MTFNAGIGVLESYTERVSRIRGFEYGRAECGDHWVGHLQHLLQDTI